MIQIAKKVVITPPDDKESFRVGLPELKKFLKGKIVKKGDLLKITHLRWPEMVEFSEFSEFSQTEDHMIKIYKTEPEGEVKIDIDTTQITYIEEIPNEEGFPPSKLIEITKRPNTTKMIPVKDLWQIQRLSRNGVMVDKFEDRSRIIYSVGNYYYEIKKSK